MPFLQWNVCAFAMPIEFRYNWYNSSVSVHVMLSRHLLYSAVSLQHKQTNLCYSYNIVRNKLNAVQISSYLNTNYWIFHKSNFSLYGRFQCANLVCFHHTHGNSIEDRKNYQQTHNIDYYTVVRQLQCNWERTISKTVYKGRFQFSCRTRIF